MGLEKLRFKGFDFTGEAGKKRMIYIIAGLVLGIISVLLIVTYVDFSPDEEVPQVENKEIVSSPISEPIKPIEEVDPRVLSPLTGELVDPEIAALRPVVVSVENSYDARPHTGVASADIVYEMYVEGVITRYLTVFQTNMPEKIGPERSARVYFLDVISELGGVYAHEGKDPLYSTVRRNYDVPDYEYIGRWWDPYSSTEPNRTSEHRAFTSIPAIRDEMVKRGDDIPASVDSWLFEEEKSYTDRGDVFEIQLNYGGSSYQSRWTYDKDLNLYSHWYGTVAHTDKAQDNAQITAKNIVVAEIKTWFRAGDTSGRRDMDISGEGTVTIFTNGEKVQGTWVKADANTRMKFYDIDGNEIPLTPGNTWVHFIPMNSNILTALEIDPIQAPTPNKTVEDSGTVQ